MSRVGVVSLPCCSTISRRATGSAWISRSSKFIPLASRKIRVTSQARHPGWAKSKIFGCTASDVVGILRKKREPFTHLEVRAEAERASGYPAVYTEIKLVYRIAGRVSRKAIEDAVRLSKEKYCSVSAMLSKTVKITFEIEQVNHE